MSTRRLNPVQQDRVEWGLRPDYGGHSIGLWAVGLYVLLIATFHATIFFSYFMIRHEAPNWPPDGFPVPPLDGVVITSLILLLTLIPPWLALRSIRNGHRLRSFIFMGVMTVGGILFMVAQLFEYDRLGLSPFDTVYPALVATLAAYHALVMITSILLTWIVMVRTWLGHFSAGRYLAVHVVVIIWWYVVLSWLLTAGTIYLTPYLT